MTPPEPLTCTLWLFAAFLLAGVVQTLWLRSSLSSRFAVPLDGGRTCRGRRIFGDNKTWGGFVVMVPAVGTAFALLGSLVDGMWPLSALEYGLLGCWVGFGFMVAELPNSFIKRQLDIKPGAPPVHPVARFVSFVVDQADSLLGGLIALAVFVPVPILVWVFTLVLGTLVHWGFNLLLKLLGVKKRAG